MKLLGTIKQVQIQRFPLKSGQIPNRQYSTSGLSVVSRLIATDRGVHGVTETGDTIIDAHHIDHPQSRNRENINSISINFTSHYQLMVNKFGPRASIGNAGENILCESTVNYCEISLSSTLVIKSARHGDVTLTNVVDAPPCAEFCMYVTGDVSLSGARMKSTLQFLSNGMRGFYATVLDSGQEFEIAPGDTIFEV